MFLFFYGKEGVCVKVSTGEGCTGQTVNVDIYTSSRRLSFWKVSVLVNIAVLFTVPGEVFDERIEPQVSKDTTDRIKKQEEKGTRVSLDEEW